MITYKIKKENIGKICIFNFTVFLPKFNLLKLCEKLQVTFGYPVCVELKLLFDDGFKGFIYNLGCGTFVKNV